MGQPCKYRSLVLALPTSIIHVHKEQQLLSLSTSSSGKSRALTKRNKGLIRFSILGYKYRNFWAYLNRSWHYEVSAKTRREQNHGELPDFVACNLWFRHVWASTQATNWRIAVAVAIVLRVSRLHIHVVNRAGFFRQQLRSVIFPIFAQQPFRERGVGIWVDDHQGIASHFYLVVGIATKRYCNRNCGFLCYFRDLSCGFDVVRGMFGFLKRVSSLCLQALSTISSFQAVIRCTRQLEFSVVRVMTCVAYKWFHAQ